MPRDLTSYSAQSLQWCGFPGPTTSKCREWTGNVHRQWEPPNPHHRDPRPLNNGELVPWRGPEAWTRWLLEFITVSSKKHFLPQFLQSPGQPVKEAGRLTLYIPQDVLVRRGCKEDVEPDCVNSILGHNLLGIYPIVFGLPS